MSIRASPKSTAVCDHCGSPLVQREDDKPESIRVRMAAYEESTKPLIDYYNRDGRLLLISAAGSPSEILERSLHALNEQLATKPA